MFQDNNIVYRFRGLFGVPVEVGRSLVFLVGLLVFMSMRGNLTHGLILAVMLIGSIYLHELGHAWGCRVQGIPVRRILLYGGGGLCERARSASARQQELIVAMGPLVNLALWALASLAEWVIWFRLSADPVGLAGVAGLLISIGFYLSVFARINLALALFNLLPVQPLDGGKLAHLILLRLMPASRALRITGVIGLIGAALWLPALIYMYVTTGWILFFIPSIRQHYGMMQGRQGA
jgi:Zn-dependent protease